MCIVKGVSRKEIEISNKRSGFPNVNFFFYFQKKKNFQLNISAPIEFVFLLLKTKILIKLNSPMVLKKKKLSLNQHVSTIEYKKNKIIPHLKKRII